MDVEPARLYQALMDLGRSFAGFKDPDSFLEELCRILRPVVGFDQLAMLLNTGTPDLLRLYTATDDARSTAVNLQKSGVYDTPAGWAWDRQETVGRAMQALTVSGSFVDRYG